MHKKKRTEKPTNEPRDDIFSQRDMLLGSYHCRRWCVLVDHENCRCPKIFLLLLLRPPKLHDEWSSTFSIFHTVHLAVKKVVVPGLESTSKRETFILRAYHGGGQSLSPLPHGDGGNGVRYLNKSGRGQP